MAIQMGSAAAGDKVGGPRLLAPIAITAFVFSIWALYGPGAKAVFWSFLVLVAGISI